MTFPRGQLQWRVSVAVDGLDVGTFSNQEMDNEDVAFSENYFHDEIRNPNSQIWFVHIAKCFCFWKRSSLFDIGLMIFLCWNSFYTYSCFLALFHTYPLLTHTFSYLNFLTLPHTSSYFFLILYHILSYIIILSRTFLQFSGPFWNFLDFLRLHTYIRVIISLFTPIRI